MTYPDGPPPPPWQQPQFYPPQQPPLARPTSGFATASMVLAILGLLVGWCSFGLPSIIAVLLGHAALKETKTGMRGGHGMAMTGLILGYIVVVPAAVFTIFLIVGAASN